MQHAPARELLHFIKNSPTCYHVIENIRQKLLANGYTELSERERWEVAPGGKYFVRRNGSSIIAFRVPEMIDGGFAMAAAHSDSPTFRLKEHPDRRSAHYVQLSTEKYGGMLMSTWFDRPLSVAGRVFVRENGEIVEKLVSVDRDLLVIPNVAIHMNRTANDGVKYLANIDTLPLLGGKDSGGILPIVAKAAGVAENDILGSDLFLYCRGEGTLLGENEEYILSPKLDDLECACGCLEGFLAAKESGNIAVCCIFDNEEVGSSTKQGAGSTFLRDTLRRIALCLGKDEQELQMMLARSFLVSADNAHAQHPNHGEYADPDNCPYMNEGVVIKFNANQRYTTDGVSCALFTAVCREAGVLFHTDAVQAAGHLPIDVKSQNIDLLSLSAHKFHGPKGTGVLYARQGIALTSLIEGGAQERGKRGGTENTPAIDGMAAALREAVDHMAENTEKVTRLRETLIAGLSTIEHARLNGDRAQRVPGTVNFCFEGIEGESLLLLLDRKGIAASSGSACTSGSLDPSHVLLAIGLPHEVAHGSLRLSVGEYNTDEEMAYIVDNVRQVVAYLRSISPVWDELETGARPHLI